MRTSEFFATPGYGEAMQTRLHYSQAVRIGNRIETSGQGGWDDDFNIPEALEDEIAQAFVNLGRTLDTAGSGWADVIHVNSYHVIGRTNSTWADHNRFMTPQFRKNLGAVMPIWTQTGVTSLGLPTMRVEIRVTAVVE